MFFFSHNIIHSCSRGNSCHFVIVSHGWMNKYKNNYTWHHRHLKLKRILDLLVTWKEAKGGVVTAQPCIMLESAQSDELPQWGGKKSSNHKRQRFSWFNNLPMFQGRGQKFYYLLEKGGLLSFFLLSRRISYKSEKVSPGRFCSQILWFGFALT